MGVRFRLVLFHRGYEISEESDSRRHEIRLAESRMQIRSRIQHILQYFETLRGKFVRWDNDREAFVQSKSF